MRLLYEAQNAIEAHMILNMLEQAGLSARIDGEYLQGAVGELQAMGIIRVMVEENDYAKAREMVDEWDANQPRVVVQKRPGRMAPFIAAVGGFGAGMVAMMLYYSSPVTYDGIDYNADGKLDEKWTYANEFISRYESDRNLDGKVDLINRYDRKGLIESSVLDENFDEVFETEANYHFGNMVSLNADTDGDGFKDYRVAYEDSVVKMISFVSAETGKVLKKQHYDLMKLKSAELDTDQDGLMDTIVEYDALEEVSRKYVR